MTSLPEFVNKKVIQVSAGQNVVIALCNDGSMYWYCTGGFDEKGVQKPAFWVAYTLEGILPKS